MPNALEVVNFLLATLQDPIRFFQVLIPITL